MQLPEVNSESARARSKEDSYARLKRRCLIIWGAVGIILVAGVVIYLLEILTVPIAILIWTLIIVFCCAASSTSLTAKA